MSRRRSTRSGFTLIEMLVVITIIGIIASMVLALSGLAGRKKKEVVSAAAINRLVLMIENYHSKLGFYPPDNALTAMATPANYDAITATNQLLYELVGATLIVGVTPTTYVGFDGTNLLASDIVALYGRGGIANSNPDEPHTFYYPPPKPSDYTVYPNSVLKGLTVPIPAGLASSGANYIHYDSSSTNRHNPSSFDVWVEYLAGTDRTTGGPVVVTNGNW